MLSPNPVFFIEEDGPIGFPTSLWKWRLAHGKTYVYLRSFFELNREIWFQKIHRGGALSSYP